MIPVEIERAARGAATLQIAVKGWWEHAEAVELPPAAHDADVLIEGAGLSDLSVEVLWPRPPIVFVGGHFENSVRPPLREIAARGDWTPWQAL